MPHLQQSAIAMFVSWLRDLANSRGFSENTIWSYESDVKLLVRFLTEHKGAEVTADDLICVTKQEIRAWFLFRKNKRDSERSIARGLSAVKSYLRHCVETGKITDSDVLTMRAPRIKKSLPRPISGAQINDIIESVAKYRRIGWMARRDGVLFALIYSVGLRISEALNLRRADIAGASGFLNINGKGGKCRMVPLLPQIRELIVEHLNNPDVPSSEFLFVGSSGGKLSASAVQSLMRKVRRLLGLSATVTPHALRHSCATHLMEESGDLREIQELLGHSSISSTQVYADVTKRRISEIYDKFHPLSKKHVAQNEALSRINDGRNDSA